MRRILFLSGIDFKEKSIQVIRKTPEAYVKAGWLVDYVVARDTARLGNYFYEREINPEGVNVIRSYWPLENFRNKMQKGFFYFFLSKLSGLMVVLKLFFDAKSLLQSGRYDVIYGYEVHGVLAVGLLRAFNFCDRSKVVTRFQGSFLHGYFQGKNTKKLITNFDHIMAMKVQSDAVIMTNDGTQGDKAFMHINPNGAGKMQFWVNGVDRLNICEASVGEIREKHLLSDKFILMTVSRLEGWKRVERSLFILNETVHGEGFKDVLLVIVGDGSELNNLRNLSERLGLQDYVRFVGAVKQSEVVNYLATADAFLSFYDTSNVGNPLLEAIRANKIIFTLSNGDTGNWIEHTKNGFIYSPDSDYFKDAARDIVLVATNKEIAGKLKAQVSLLENKKLWTWEERLDAEVDMVSKL